MPQFDYKARSKDGQIKAGTIEANDRRGAIHRLQEQGLSPVTVTAVVGKSGGRSLVGKLLEKSKALKARPASVALQPSWKSSAASLPSVKKSD